MYSAGAKQPDNELDKAWLILLGSLLFVGLLVCAVWYARAVDCPFSAAGNCNARVRRRTGVNFAGRNPPVARTGTVVSLKRS
jgi:hypothetical protein